MVDFVPGIDGLVPFGTLAETGCCPPDICDITLPSLICNFVNLLPSGPLWDAAKQEVTVNCKSWCEDDCIFIPEDSECTSLVRHSVYTANKMFNIIFTALWPSLRESDPWTAYTTIDEWLDRIGWADCQNPACSDGTASSPFTSYVGCQVPFCQPVYSPELQTALNKAILKSLWRARLGVIGNLAAINFVIAPLEAELVPNVDPDACLKNKFCFTLRRLSTSLPRVFPEACPKTDRSVFEEMNRVDAEIDIDVDCRFAFYDQSTKVYPAQLAAECIVRSLMPTDGSICLILEC